MFKKLLLGFLIVLSLFTLFGCASSGVPVPKQGEFLEIGVDKAKELISTDKNLLILDVRTLEEFQGGHIPGAKLLTLGTELEAGIAQLDKNQTTLVVCLSGERSKMASRFLAQNGFTKVYNMVGGMNSWDGNVER